MIQPDANDGYHLIHPDLQVPEMIRGNLERRTQALREEMIREIQDDTAYFHENPDRKYRLRHAFPKEEEYLRLMEIMIGEEICPDERFEMLIVIKRDESKSDNTMLRMPISNTKQTFTPGDLADISETRQDLIESLFPK